MFVHVGIFLAKESFSLGSQKCLGPDKVSGLMSPNPFPIIKDRHGGTDILVTSLRLQYCIDGTRAVST